MLLAVQLGLLLNLPLPERAFANEGAGPLAKEYAQRVEKEEKVAGPMANMSAEGAGETTGDDALGSEMIAPVFPQRDDYLASNTSEDIVGMALDEAKAEEEASLGPGLIGHVMSLLAREEASGLVDSGHTLYMKYTLVDARIVGEDESLDDVYAHADWMEALLGQYDISVDLLDPGSGSDYFVGLADLGNIKGAFAAQDAVFTELSNEGVVLEGLLFDAATGIAYIPKELYYEDGHEIPYAVEGQIMVRVDLAQEPTTCFDVRIENDDPRVRPAADASHEASLFDVDVEVPIIEDGADAIALEDLTVRINGSTDAIELVEGTNASYDPLTGHLSLFFAPINLLSIDVAIAAPSFIDLLVPTASAATSSQSLAYVPDVVFDSLDMDSLRVGSGFYFETTADYWWPSSVGTPHIVYEACINSGAYCYSWVSDPDALYEYVAWTNGADWNGVAQGNVGNFPGITTDSSDSARNYFNYVFWFGNMEAGGQNWHSERWPRNIPAWDPGYWGSRFGLQCSHSKKPIGNLTHQGSEGSTMWARVLDVNTDAERPYIVLGFCGPAIANQPGIGVYKFAIEVEGRIGVEKASTLPGVTEGNAAYDLSQLSYDVYADEGCTRLVCSIGLDANGRGESGKLARGTYYLREHAPAENASGYAIDENVHAITVGAGRTSVLQASDEPQVQEVDIVVTKHDVELAANMPQGNATLAGAEFTVRYFPGRYASVEEALASGSPLRQWVLVTDEDGIARFSSADLGRGDAAFISGDHRTCLPIGTVLIQETRAPGGYLLSDSTVYLEHVDGIGTTPDASGFDPLVVDDGVMRGGLLIEKHDRESSAQGPLGGARLDGTTFAIMNRSMHAVLVGGIRYEPNEVVSTIVVKDGRAETAPDALPYGDYAFQEVSAGEGYLLTDGGAHAFSITKDGQLVSYSDANAIANQVKRGDLELVKMRATDNKRLAGVPFRLTSKTTGESHVLVTDKNGHASTQASWNAHTYLTNLNDQCVFGDGTVHEKGLDALAGVWFGRSADGSMTSADNSLGALPYDTYTLEELRCKANEHMELVTLDDLRIVRDAVCIDLGTIENRPEGERWITTSARAAETGLKSLDPEESVSIVDRIEYGGLDVGKRYRMEGALMVKEESGNDADAGAAASGTPLLGADGTPVTASLEFTPEAISGYIELEFSFDAMNLYGRSVVCFERLVELDSGEVIAMHEDIDDYDQTVRVTIPRIGTFATDGSDGDKLVGKTENARIVDRISYANVAIGREYVFDGTLMRKTVAEDGSTSAEELLDAQGTPITSSVSFVPESPSGTAEVSFAFDARNLEDGTEIVVFETLSSEGHEYVVHTDAGNAAQTVSIEEPRIATTARDGQDGDKELMAGPDAVVIDAIEYEGLVPGRPYYAFGRLMQVSTFEDGTTEAWLLTDPNGEEVTAFRGFVPDAADGVIEVAFRFDGSGLAADENAGGSGDADASAPAKTAVTTKLVVFEDLYQGDVLVATHADPDDEAQTIMVSNGNPPTRSDERTGLPQTGDDVSAISVLIAFALLGAIATVVAAAARRRRNDRGITGA